MGNYYLEEIRKAKKEKKSIVKIYKNICYDNLKQVKIAIHNFPTDGHGVNEHLKQHLIDEIARFVGNRERETIRGKRPGTCSFKWRCFRRVKDVYPKINLQSMNRLATLKILSMQCSFTQLESGIFESLKNLEELDLSYNRLKSIEDNTFIGLERLKILKLNSNCLKAFKSKSFSGLSNLELLNLSNNNNIIIEADLELFECLQNLKSFLVDTDTNVNYLIRNFKCLEFLYLNVRYSTLSLGFPLETKSLIKLSLKFVKIDSPDMNPFQNLYNLQELFIDKLEILCKNKHLDNLFDYLISLKSLSIVFFDRNSFADDFASAIIYTNKIQLDNLSIRGIHVERIIKTNTIKHKNLELYFYKVKFELFDSITFNNMQILTKLRLEGEKDQNFDKILLSKDLKNLVELGLVFSNCASILRKDHFKNFIKLKSLTLKCDCLRRYIEADFFSFLISLEYLNLMGNGIQEIDVNGFRNLDNLVSLNLEGNSINHLNEFHFKNLPNLKHLDVSNNRINSINGFSCLKNLERLYAIKNSFCIDLKEFINLKSLKELYFDDIIRSNDRDILFYMIEVNKVKIDITMNTIDFDISYY